MTLIAVDEWQWDDEEVRSVHIAEGPTHVHECPRCKRVLPCGGPCQWTVVKHGLVYSDNAPEQECECPDVDATNYIDPSSIPGH